MKKLLTVFTMVLILCGLCSCGVSGAEEAVQQYLDALIALDYDTANAMVMVEAGNEDKVDPVLSQSDFNDALFAALRYDIWSSEKLDTNTVTVTMTMSQIAMKQVYAAVIVEYSDFIMEQADKGIDPTEQQITQMLNQYMLEAIRDNQMDKTTFTVVVKLIKIDDQWKVVMDKALLNGLFGGLIEAMEALIDTENGS